MMFENVYTIALKIFIFEKLEVVLWDSSILTFVSTKLILESWWKHNLVKIVIFLWFLAKTPKGFIMWLWVDLDDVYC